MINESKFVSWIESRFDSVVIKGNEIKVNSPFCEDDRKHHLWCNPTGGKKERPYGVYRCWKTDKRGSLVSLVMFVDKCSFEEAVELLEGSDNLAQLEQKIEAMFEHKSYEEPVQILENGISLPPMTFPISSLEDSDFYKSECEIYLYHRKLSPEGLMVCTGGDYRNRIVIPYYDKNGKLIYFNARLLRKNDKLPKYMGPDKSIGIGKSDVVYFKQWPSKGSKVYLVEGEFDSMSIVASGLSSCALGGKEIYENQMAYLRDYTLVVSLDNDKSGKNATPKMCGMLKSRGFNNIGYIRPPTKYKDWNEMLVDIGPSCLQNYLLGFEKPFNDYTDIQFEL